jgi:hypothetical protein
MEKGYSTAGSVLDFFLCYLADLMVQWWWSMRLMIDDVLLNFFGCSSEFFELRTND